MLYAIEATRAQPAPTPNLAEARAHLAAIDPHQNAKFSFRTVGDRSDDPRLCVKLHGTLTRGVRQSSNPAKNGRPCRTAGTLKYMQNMGAGAFFVPSEMDGVDQKKQNVVRPRSLFIDADTHAAVELTLRLIDAGLTPTVIIESGG